MQPLAGVILAKHQSDGAPRNYKANHMPTRRKTGTISTLSATTTVAVFGWQSDYWHVCCSFVV
jgi:hypothetical protein